MEDKLKEKEKRHTCFYCHSKRYESNMRLIFAHPIITGKNPFYACAPGAYGGYKALDGCIDKALKEIMMYHNTGMLQLTPITK